MGYFSLISSFIVLLSIVCIVTSDSQAVRYDKNVNLFSSTGELLQVQYARNAGMKGSPILCSQTSNDEIVVCIPTSPSLQSLQDRRAVDKLAKISDGIWFAFAGLAGDGRALLKASRNFCTEYQSKFGSIPSVRSVARYIGELQHESTLAGGKRPYGVQVLLIGAEDSTGKLAIYSSEPSGEYASWKAVAIGMNADKHMAQLEEGWAEGLSTVETAALLARTASRDRSDEEKDTNESEDATRDGAMDLYRFRPRRTGSGKQGRGTMSYHASVEELTKSVEAGDE